MLRISIVTDADATTIKLEGKFLGPWCGEVTRTCRDAMAPPRRLPVRLDLYDVDFIDNDGLLAIRALRNGGGVTLSRCSNFVAELLHTERV